MAPNLSNCIVSIVTPFLFQLMHTYIYSSYLYPSLTISIYSSPATGVRNKRTPCIHAILSIYAQRYKFLNTFNLAISILSLYACTCSSIFISNKKTVAFHQPFALLYLGEKNVELILKWCKAGHSIRRANPGHV